MRISEFWFSGNYLKSVTEKFHVFQNCLIYSSLQTAACFLVMRPLDCKVSLVASFSDAKVTRKRTIELCFLQKQVLPTYVIIYDLSRKRVSLASSVQYCIPVVAFSTCRYSNAHCLLLAAGTTQTIPPRHSSPSKRSRSSRIINCEIC